MIAARRAMVCLGCCVAGLVAVPVAAFGEGAPSEGSRAVAGDGASSVLNGSLVIAGTPTEGEERRAQAEAERHSPKAFFVRERSRTEYEGLGVQAAQVDRSVFPDLVERQAGGMPRLPVGSRLVKYVSPTAAQLDLPGGRHGALESTSVIAKPGADGRLAPVELGLERSGSGYRPKAPVVAVNIPERLSEGVSAPASGVALVPTDSRGVPLGGSEGSLQDASVLYANSATDTDTVAKPTRAGFELDAILRSQRSPRTLYYRVRMPRGARLAQRSGGDVEVIGAHGGIGRITAPSAQDASGAAVPVTMGVAGDTLVVGIGGTADETQWPIDVDPEYGKKDSLSPGWEECPLYGVCTRGMHNWEFITSNSQIYEMNVEAAYWWPIANYKGGEYAGIEYKTQGESKIYAFEAKTKTVFGYNVEANIDLIKPNGKGGYEPESEQKLSSSETSKEYQVCGGSTCEVTSGYPGNIARFMTDTTAEGKAKTFVAAMEVGDVYVSQEKGPEVSFNTTSPTITVNGATRTNVLYGSGAWLSPYSGAIGFSATDPGIGVSAVKLKDPNSSLWQEVNYHREGLCRGLRCEPASSGSFTYSPIMENGEHSFHLSGEDEVKAPSGEAEATIKVDTSKPYNLGFTGMPEVGAEVSAAPHALTVHATDGKKPTPSSGIRSISVSIDGATSMEVSRASCPAGECTASGEYTLNAESLSEGVHRLVVDAVSNSGEPEAKEFLFDVRHASPVSVGPGSVDPTTGQLTLAAGDVSLGGASGVSRSYQSRNLTAGASGPLGPQWAMSVGGGEGLTVLPSGSVVLVSGSGGATTFTLNAKGEFEAPKGDENLKIEYKSAEHKYVLKDATAGSETVFEQPTGTQSTPPTFGEAFGAEAGVLNRPVSVALDASGDLWITDWANDRVAEYSKTGTLIATYGSEGAESGQFNRPWGIAVNQSTGNVYVTDSGNSRIVELSSSGAFIRAIGWGVSNDKAELQTCTSSCLAGIAGTGAGQLDAPQGMAIDSSGNLWVAEYNSNRIQEFSETGSYITAFGTAGSGAGQFEGPMNIAFAGGDVYVTDQNNNRVDELSTSGSFIETIGWGVSNGEEKLETCTSSCKAGKAGTGNGQFNGPRGLAVDPVSGSLYVSEITNNRVQEITTSGSFVTKFGSGGSGAGKFAQPMGVAAASTGAIYVTDFEHASVQEWMRPTWLPTSAKGSLPAHTTYTYTPVENSEGVISMQPYEVTSPTPHGVECGTKIEELKEEKDKGCRALTFKYATSTTAKGESQSEWGEYKGHLSQVMFHAWSPSTKAMEEKAVAQYTYDSQGRLRAEWDPRIEASTACGKTCSALKATYGYDFRGHVTSVMQAGQQPWLISYGTSEGDVKDRVIAVSRPRAATAFGNGSVPVNTATPTISTIHPVVGERVSVSNGTWSNSPLAYSYQWYRCVVSGCERITGAVNQTYTPLARDREHKLGVIVAATNAAGTAECGAAAPCGPVAVGETEPVSGSSELSVEPLQPAPSSANSVSTVEYRVPLSGSKESYLPNLTKEEVEKWGQKDNGEYEDNDPVEGMAIFPPDEQQGWPASDYKRATIDYMNGKGLTVNAATPTGGIATTEYNELNEATRTLSADNRAAAMKEGCVSLAKKECKSAEVAERLDTKTEYNAEGSQIVKVLGPEHKVKLSTGEEAQSRAVTRNHYDEGAQEVEEKNGETYNLVTKSTSGALLANGEEKDVRTTITSYSGQEDLGWKLRKPTETITDPTGLDLVHKTFYDKTTGSVIETRTPAASAEAVAPPSLSTSFGAEGAGGGQFKRPVDVALDSSGNEWVVDQENNRIEKFSPSGAFIEALGWGVSNGEAKYEICTSGCRAGIAGTGAGQFSSPWTIAINQSTGNLYIGDSENNRIEELGASGEFIEAFGWGVSDGKSELEVCKASCKGGIGGSGNGQLSYPRGLVIDSQGNVWVTDERNNRIEEFSSSGSYISRFGGKGSGEGQFVEPMGVAISEGDLYVLDRGNSRVEEFSMGGMFLAQFGGSGTGPGQLKEPVGIAANPNTGNIYVADTHNERVQAWSPAGKFLVEFGIDGTGKGLMNSPTGLTISPTGGIYIANEYDYRVDLWLPPEAGNKRLVYSTQFGAPGSGHEQFSEPASAAVDGHGDIWVVDRVNDRIEELSPSGKYIAAYGTHGSGEVQFSGPHGIAINQSTGNIYVSDGWNNRVEELSSSGKFIRAWGGEGVENGKFKTSGGITIDSSGNVWVTDINNSRIQEFSSEGAFIASYGLFGTENRQFEWPEGITFAAGHIYVSDGGNDRVQELTTSGEYVAQFGGEGDAGGQFKHPVGITSDSAGNLYVADMGHNRVQEFNSSGTFLTAVGSLGAGEGQLSSPQGLAVNAAGSVYVADSANNRIEIWVPADEAAHDAQMVYYSAEANSTYPNCGNHPEWAELVCQTQPAAQPGRGLPELPVSTVASYNIWDEAEKTEEKFGTGSKAVTRTKTETYDPAGRAVTSEETTSPETGKPLPKVTDEYNTETGALEKQGTSEGTITSRANTLGQQIEYKDASGNVAKYAYEEGSDGRLEEVSEGKGEEAKSSQTFSYNTTTGLMEKLVDSAAGAFKAGYDVEGKMTSETYPNNMTASYTINSIGTATGIVYEKNADCASKCPETWFSDSVVPSIHGEMLQQTSTLSKENYAYDNAGRLLETQETPAGKGCVVRLYAYDEEGNRSSETKREPGTEGKCSTEGGTVERHTYDEANRLTDEGVEYETFGNTTKMPSGDAGGHEIVSTYYVDNQVATEKQNEQLLKYTYDPSGRTMEMVTENEKAKTKVTTITHYAGSGNALTWTSEGSEKWTRNIPGIDGALDAVQEAGKTPVLQLHDLQGDIVGTVEDSETATKLATTYNSIEFGVPNEGKTLPKYAWLGAAGVSTEPSQGTGTSTQSGASYVPQIARALQTAPVVPPGAFPNGSPGTQTTAIVSPAALAYAQAQATQAWQVAEAERQKAREEEAKRYYVWGEDPPEEAIYFTINEAIFWYNAAVANEAVDIAYDLFKYVKSTIARPVVEWVESQLGLHDFESWLDTIKAGLGECIQTGQFFLWYVPEARCRVGLPMVTIFEINIFGTVYAKLEIPDARKLPNVEICAYYGQECISTIAAPYP